MQRTRWCISLMVAPCAPPNLNTGGQRPCSSHLTKRGRISVDRARRETGFSVQEVGAALVAPGSFVGERELVELLGPAARVVDPAAQKIAAAQQVDREAV